MSRVIKFRAWNRELAQMGQFKDAFFEFTDSSGRRLESWYLITATAASPIIEVMQFTGLHDKNGVEIYEGDVVTIGAGDCCSVRTIIFGEGSFCIDVAGCSLGVFAHIACVIGNIYANPELLEGNDNAG